MKSRILVILFAVLTVAAVAQGQPYFSQTNWNYVNQNAGVFKVICQAGNFEIIGSTMDHPYGYVVAVIPVPDCDESDNTPRTRSDSEILALLIGAFGPNFPGSGNAAAPAVSSRRGIGYQPVLLPLAFAPFFQRNDFLNAVPTCNPALQPVVYVVNHDSGSVTAVSPCPAQKLQVITGFSRPLQVAFTPDATSLLVTCYDNAVAFVDPTTNQITTQIDTGQDIFPNGIAITPDGSKAYVTSFIDVSPAVIVIDLTTRKVVNRIPMPYAYPVGITITPDGTQAWVRFLQQDPIVVIDTLTNTLGSTITSLLNPTGVAFDPSGKQAYVSSFQGGVLYVVNAATFDTVTSIRVGSSPIDVAISSNGRWVNVINSASTFLSVIDADTNTVVDQTAVGFGTLGLTVVQ